MAYHSNSGLIQASSSLHGSIMRRDPEGYDMPSDLDQALLYFDGQQDKLSTQEPHKPLNFLKETLNIFPSQPMHVEPSPKGSMASSAPHAAGSSRRSPPSKAAGGPLAMGNGSKAAFKREGSSTGKRSSTAAAAAAAASSSELEGPKTPDPKTLRRLAQNREAARKSRLRKKAYIQQLESGRMRLVQVEQEIQMTRAQGALWGTGTLSPDAALFNLEYERWRETHHKMIARLRAAAEEHHRPDGELQPYVDEAASHYGVLMGHKAKLAGADPLHLLSGLWKGAAERCFLWIGGFRPSELIKIVLRHVEPLTEQQLMGVCGVQQSAKREEDALDGELEALLRSLSDVVSSSDALQPPMMYYHPADMVGYMGHYVSLAMDKLASLETFLRQADELRLQTLHALRQILTVRQSARCFVAVDDYFGRLRTLSTLWTTSRPTAVARGPGG